MGSNKRSYFLSITALWFCCFLCFCNAVFSQSDTVKLREVAIQTYPGEHPVIRLPASVAVVDSLALQLTPSQSPVSAMNSLSGVRMEERSPGSYRFSIRGSLLRSPFGVRNVKVFLNDFPLTNAGGETYLNILDFNTLNNVEVLKGPEGSFFGPNTGGVLRLNTRKPHSEQSFVKVGAGVGSFGMMQEDITVQKKFGIHLFSIAQAWQRSDGYRRHSALERKYFRVGNKLSYSSKNSLDLLLMYTDLDYQTPGALTITEFNEDSRQARPATLTLPGAVEQKAGVRNQSLFGGLTHKAELSPRITHVLSMFGSKTDFENPFITNYEKRYERNSGARTWFEFYNKADSGIAISWDLGAELQSLQSRIVNYSNINGRTGDLQASDDADVTQGFVFTKVGFNFFNRWQLDASLSYNDNWFAVYRSIPSDSIKDGLIRLTGSHWMPRLAASWLVTPRTSLRFIVSRGYSPPSLQEIRSSDTRINRDLRAENGWNAEAGIRLRSMDDKISYDASVFYYRLNNAIVRRINSSGQEYFVNAGSTDQPGIESQISISLVKKNAEGFFKEVDLTNASTVYMFRFAEYRIDAERYSGNALTGVPRFTGISGLHAVFPLRFYTYLYYNYTGQIPLNDANSVYAGAYNLVQLKAGWKYPSDVFTLDISVGVDNLLDERYSLGNDINAVGGRYYNAAAGRNYFARLIVTF